MDYHHKARFHQNQGALPIGHLRPAGSRLSPAAGRPTCSRSSDEGGVAEPESEGMEMPPGTRGDGKVGAPAQTSPKLRGQVKQLQYWLKVFSRFCREEPEQESDSSTSR